MRRRSEAGRTRLFAGDEPKRLPMPSRSKPETLRWRVLFEVPVSTARSAAGSPNKTSGLILSYSICSFQAQRSSSCSQRSSSADSTRRLLFLRFPVPMLPPPESDVCGTGSMPRPGLSGQRRRSGLRVVRANPGYNHTVRYLWPSLAGVSCRGRLRVGQCRPRRTHRRRPPEPLTGRSPDAHRRTRACGQRPAG